MTYSTDIRVPCKAAEIASRPASLGRLFLASVKTLQTWYERSRQRRCLALLDEHLLRDIGLDRLTAMEEASKPFWRD